MTLTNDDAPYDSDSDLSDVANPILDIASPAASLKHEPDDSEQEQDATSSAVEVQEVSDDADYDLDDDPPTTTAIAESQRSASTESRRPAKRKLGVEDDEHILANPELYGLRRSVCSLPLALSHSSC